MGPWEACAADKSGQAMRRDEVRETTWTCWEMACHRGCEMSRDNETVDVLSLSPEAAEAFNDWKPIDPIDAVTLLGELEDTE